MISGAQNAALQSLDEALPHPDGIRRELNVLSRGWLRGVRTALGATQTGVAKKLGVTRQSYDDLERTEERGAITMNRLQQAADALGCELVYFLKPKKGAANSFVELGQMRDAPPPVVPVKAARNRPLGDFVDGIHVLPPSP
jgi:transcriptional regulator with XRE-family HTH domain